MPSLTVSQLLTYPLKSARAVKLSQMMIDVIGPRGDRRWMIVDSAGDFITQRQYPKSCRVDAVILVDGLHLSAPGMEPIKINPVDKSNAVSKSVTVWGDRVDALDCGQLAADWLSLFLGTNSRLVYMSDNCHRLISENNTTGTASVGFADAFPILLISQASLDDLNDRLESAVEMLRFRPNIVVQGCEPFAEDNWRRIQIGEISLDVAKPCARCSIPTINPETADRNMDVSAVLASYRARDKQVYFGQNLIHRNIGSIALGDALTVLC